MSTWGRSTYGDPCRDCGYAWPDDLDPTLAWDARSYVCHIVDNLRIWAERLAAATEVSVQAVGTYDADLLATARDYSTVPLRGIM